MTDRLTLRAWNPQQAHQELTNKAWPWLKSMLLAGHRMQIEVKKEKRSLAENAMLHALLGQIAGQVEWAGAKRDIETWKRLLTASWCRARGEEIETLPALDGQGVDIVFRRTSELTRLECADLIEYIQAWAAQCGIELGDRE
jgi:hypothetical protein